MVLMAWGGEGGGLFGMNTYLAVRIVLLWLILLVCSSSTLFCFTSCLNSEVRITHSRGGLAPISPSDHTPLVLPTFWDIFMARCLVTDQSEDIVNEAIVIFCSHF